MTKYAICILCVKPNPITVDYLHTLHRQNYDVYICLDNINVTVPKYNPSIVNVLKIDSDVCEKNHYFGTVDYCPNRACSRDKALYHFSFINTSYDYVWFLEEDVFIPDKHTIELIDVKYSCADLLSQEHTINYGDGKAEHWQHWDKSKNKIALPWAKSMICAVRVSHILLQRIKSFSEKYRHLLFDEMLFNTIALHNDLVVETPNELKHITFSFSDVCVNTYNKSCLYQPVRDIQKHKIARSKTSAITNICGEWRNIHFQPQGN